MKLLRLIPLLLRFVAYYVKEVFRSSIRVAHDVLTPKDHANPAIIALPLDTRSDQEILAVANLISMTPGTLSMDVSSDKKVLYVHVMFVDHEDVEALRMELKNTIERRVLELFRVR